MALMCHLYRSWHPVWHYSSGGSQEYQIDCGKCLYGRHTECIRVVRYNNEVGVRGVECCCCQVVELRSCRCGREWYFGCLLQQAMAASRAISLGQECQLTRALKMRSQALAISECAFSASISSLPRVRPRCQSWKLVVGDHARPRARQVVQRTYNKPYALCADGGALGTLTLLFSRCLLKRKQSDEKRLSSRQPEVVQYWRH